MSDSLFEISVLGEKQVSRIFEGLDLRVADLRPVWQIIAEDFRKIERRQFETEGGLWRSGWPALSPEYATWKARHYPGKKILELTGRLKASLTGKGPGSVEDLSHPDWMKIGTAVPYAIYHQTGTRRMPARPPLVIPEGAKKRWIKAIHAYIKGGDVLEAIGPWTSIFD